jgi:hypothetical protein
VNLKLLSVVVVVHRMKQLIDRGAKEAAAGQDEGE